jgi:putative ABC transport system permease protein
MLSPFFGDLMHALTQDIRYAFRQMQRAPGFALIAVLTLALGAGLATAIFSVIDAVILRPLPYDQPERIYTPVTISGQGYGQPPSYLSYKDMRAQNHNFAALAGVWPYGSVNLESPSGPVALRSVEGTDNFFDVFGVSPVMGRTFRPGEDQPGKSNVVLLSYEVWQSNFGGQKDVIGKAIRLDGNSYTCIGVMSAGFNLRGIRNAVYTPLHSNHTWWSSRGTHWLGTIGRLKSGVTKQQAQADMDAVLANIGRAYPDTDAGRKVQLIGIADSINGNASSALWTLAGAALAVLAIGCVNLTGLLLARGVKREREIALRTAIGADRGRLVRQILTESLLLAAFGAAGGIFISWLLLTAMRVFLVKAMARGAEVHLNLTVLLAALAISVAASVVASLAPAVRLSGIDPKRALKSGGNAGTARTHQRLRSAFIVTQMALSLVLLSVAGVLLHAVAGHRNTNLGFDAKHILAAEIDLSPGRYDGRDLWTDFYQPLVERVRHLPGVQAAGLINIVPIQSYGSNREIHLTGQPPYPPNEVTLAEMRFASEGYFDAMGIRLVRGRMLSPSIDVPTNKAGTMVVNQAFVKKFIPKGLDPIGQHVDDSDKADEKTGIAGVVTDVRQALSEPSMPEMDWLYSQMDPKDRSEMLIGSNLIVRTAGDPKAEVASLREVFHQIDPTLPFRAPETMEEIVSDQLVMERMESWLFGIFAALAVALALVGLYGLISHEVELGTRDIGVRMALGASRGSVLGMVMRRVALLLATGVASGLLLTAAAKKVIASVAVIHFGQEAGLLALLALALGLAGALAALIPARRAASIEPMQALRME